MKMLNLQAKTVQRRYNKRASKTNLFQFDQDAFLGSGGDDEALLDKRQIFLPRLRVEDEEATLVLVSDICEIWPQHCQMLKRKDFILCGIKYEQRVQRHAVENGTILIRVRDAGIVQCDHGIESPVEQACRQTIMLGKKQELHVIPWPDIREQGVLSFEVIEDFLLKL